MEFLPGAFERDWERRRATLLHEFQMRRSAEDDWEWPRRGGAARLPPQERRAFGGRGRIRAAGGRSSFQVNADAGRPMRVRFEALARGSQPAVVKLASYGGGARAAAMLDYVSRGGELGVENEKGERVVGKAALGELRSEWEHLFDHRAASRDIGNFHINVENGSLPRDRDQNELLREILRAGFGDRRFVYAVENKVEGGQDVRGVLVLRERGGERLTGDSQAAAIVQQRFDASDIGNDVEARFRFQDYGNGVRFGTVRVRDLVERFDGIVHDESGRAIDGVEQAGNLVQKEWRHELHSRKGRDVIHLIASARAGTDSEAFQRAVRDFLGEQFAGHRYVFAVHDPSDDPKETGEGGKRPHIHAHAIVTMRAETGGRLVTSPNVFREWRATMAEKAREQGINMELTDRRECASPPAYTRNQVRPISYTGRTEHEGMSEPAQMRYGAKRANLEAFAGGPRSRDYAESAAELWRELANGGDATVVGFAAQQVDRIQIASRTFDDLRQKAARPIENKANMVTLKALIEIEEAPMREMTRPEFEAYEKRVETILTEVGISVEETKRKDFDEIAAAARDVVDIRREYLAFTERQADTKFDNRDHPSNGNDHWDQAVGRHGVETVERGNDAMVQIETARRSIDQAKTDRDLHRTIDAVEQSGGRKAATAASSADQNARRPEERSEKFADTAIGGKSSEGAPLSSGTIAQQGREVVRDERSDHENDRDSEVRHPGEKEADERKASTEQRTLGKTARSNEQDPPQQQIPRLQELEQEIEHQRERDNDDRGR